VWTVEQVTLTALAHSRAFLRVKRAGIVVYEGTDPVEVARVLAVSGVNLADLA
jgi:hypothetical protein